MRTSKRDSILQAALHVVETDGVTAVTYESVAAASGLTKGGLLYHFPSKDALVLALHEHLAERWDHEMINVLGKDPDEATQDERVAAYARVSARSATGPELLFMLEASTDSELNKPWRRVISRWIPDPAEIDPTDPRALQKMVAYLAADGLWLSESVGAAPLPPELRAALAELGIGDAWHLGIADGGVSADVQRLHEWLQDMLRADDLVLAPWRLDGHRLCEP